MRNRFWLFDIASDDRGERIYIWGLSRDGSPHLFIDDSFKDFIYVLDVNLERLKARLIEALGSRYSDLSIESTYKILNGVKTKAYILSGSEEILKIAERVITSSFGVDKVFEGDVRYTQKYILYRGFKPAEWYDVEYGELLNLGGYKGYKLISFKHVADIPNPKLKVLSLDYVITSQHGSPDPQRDPVNAILLFDGRDIKSFIAEDGDDIEMIRHFTKYVEKADPDVIVSFYGNRVFYPYIVNRFKTIGLSIDLGRYPKEIHQSILGHFSFGGRINIDLYEYVDDIPFFQRKTLEELAEQLNIDRPKNYVDPLLYHKYWVDERDKLIKYIGWRVRTLYKAFRALENDIYTLSSVTGIPPDYVLTSSSGRQIEFYIMNQAVRKGIIIPRVIERSVRSYQGGLVIKPVVGLHKNICVVDFKSMYPSIMIKYNISPETIVSSELDDSIFFKEVGLGVKTSVEGLFPEILRTLLRLRDDARDKLLKIPRSTPEYNLLDARQRIYKILANTVYGYMGWPQARWYSYEGASLVTYLGRKAISQAIKYAENLGLKVIYGDTDSLFIYYDEAVVEDLLNRIYEELGLEAKVDKIYRSILFTEAKKRYAGYTYEGNIDIVGLEYTRRDWCQYSRELQYEVVKAVLVDGDKKKAIDIFREYVSKLRKREIPLEKLVIWEQITRNLQDYKANSPHIEVAKNLERRGWRIRRGMFIGYIILKGSGPLYKRSTYYVDADIDDIDINYYIYSQLLPVVHRILSPLGVSRSSLEAVATGTGRGLDMFMG
ncbi:MAG TPA: hypothetical protein EYH44_02050 [Thermoprotei archaeon]|nr:hypothetical protein [Thermoprotei archaeon]